MGFSVLLNHISIPKMVHGEVISILLSGCDCCDLFLFAERSALLLFLIEA